MRPIFRLPSSPVTMWLVKIDSRTASTPVDVFTLLVTCVVGTTSDGCGVGLKIYGTDVEDDLSRCVYNRMDNRLRKELVAEVR